MNQETLLRSALAADAETAPSGAGLLRQVRRRAAARRARVRTAGALAVVAAGVAAVAGAATLLPLTGGQGLPPRPATSVTPTPRTAVPGLVEVPAFTPPRTLVPGYLPAQFSTGYLFWYVVGTDTTHDFRLGGGHTQLAFSVGSTSSFPTPGGPEGVPGNPTWTATTIAGGAAEQWHQGPYSLLRWHTADGRPVRVFANGPVFAEVRRFAEGLHPGVPDFRPMLTPHLMPAGWRVAGVDRRTVSLSSGPSARIYLSVGRQEDGPWPLRVGGHPAKLHPQQDRRHRGLVVLIDPKRSLTLMAQSDRPDQVPLPTAEQVEAIAAAVEVAPGEADILGAARLGGN